MSRSQSSSTTAFIRSPSSASRAPASSNTVSSFVSHCDKKRVALFLQEHSRLYGLVEARRAEAAPRAEIEHWTQRREKALKNRSGVIDLTARLLGRMAEDCRRAGVAFVVLAFPDKETFRGDKSWLEGLTTSLSEENISVVDMAERFQARGLLFSEIASDNIGHLSARGHVAASEIVREVLVERSLAAPYDPTVPLRFPLRTNS